MVQTCAAQTLILGRLLPASAAIEDILNTQCRPHAVLELQEGPSQQWCESPI